MERTTRSSQGIILDIDETLIHSMETMDQLENMGLLKNYDSMDLRKRIYLMNLPDVVGAKGTGNITPIWGIKRPGLEEFLNFCFDHFRFVAIWSAGKSRYVHCLVDIMFNLESGNYPHVVFTRNHCEADENGILVKPIDKMINSHSDISKVLSRENCFIIDDRETTFGRNPDNGIIIPAYDPQPNISDLNENDFALKKLMNWFKRPEVANCPDITKLDKNNIFN